MTRIEWTEATWNPLAGCTIVSPGCTNCYAMKMAARLERMLPAEKAPQYRGLTKPSKAGPVWTGKVALAPEHILTEPLRRKKPTMWFVNSMSDLFHEDVPDEWILRVLDVIRATSHDGGANCGSIRHENRQEGQHVYQVLTKRSARMLDFMSRLAWDGERLHLRNDRVRARVILRNLWLGVSAERQNEADERIPDLLNTPAAVRFVSAEPLLGPIDFRNLQHPEHPTKCSSIDIAGFGRRLDWIIVGGESGADARPMHPDWARAIRDQCDSAGTAFFFKQWGAWAPTKHPTIAGDSTVWPNGQTGGGDANANGGAGREMIRVGKHRAGCLLDGREWKEMPEARA